MRVSLRKSFGFESAHWLPKFPDGHKCRRLHGHSFRVDVVVEGEVPEEDGFPVDFAVIKAAIKPLEEMLEGRAPNHWRSCWALAPHAPRAALRLPNLTDGH